MASRQARSSACHKAAKPLVWCLVTPIYVAFFLVECYYTSLRRGRSRRSGPRHSYREECERLDREYAPRPLLPEQRPRPLTACGQSSPLDTQQDSPLFKLPAELRLRIYHEVLGGNVFHLLLKPHRVGHVLCDERPKTYPATDDLPEVVQRDPERKCLANRQFPDAGSIPGSYGRGFKTRHKTSDPDSCAGRKMHSLSGYLLRKSDFSLSLLLSCRRLYCEAIDTLYKDNVFDINHPQTFVLFADTILPQRLALIQSLQLLWAHPPLDLDREFESSPDPWWRDLWTKVATQKRMPALRHVSLRVEWWSSSWPKLDMENIVAPMLAHLRGLRSFEISIMQQRPFELEDNINGQDNVSDEVRKAFELASGLKKVLCAPPEATTGPAGVSVA